MIDRGANGLFRADTDEGAYTKNYLLWDGLIETEDGALTYCNLESGNYVIVMQPTTPGRKSTGASWLFSQNSERQDQFLNSDAWSELEAMAEKYGWTVDPVDLLTGSFKWEYQDLALYGKDDLPFIRYYNSSDFEDDHGLGLGWSSNYTAFLDIENLFVRAILPNGRELYFNLNFDDTFRPVGDCTLEWAGGEFLLKNTSDGTSYAFTKEGDLARIDYLNGNTVQFSYTGDQLTEISNASGSLCWSTLADTYPELRTAQAAVSPSPMTAITCPRWIIQTETASLIHMRTAADRGFQPKGRGVCPERV